MNVWRTIQRSKLQRDERGLSTVEYVVLLVLIVAIAVALWNVFGNLLVSKLSAGATEFDQEVVTAKSGSDEATNSAGASAEINEAAGSAGGGGGGSGSGGGSGGGSGSAGSSSTGPVAE